MSKVLHHIAIGFCLTLYFVSCAQFELPQDLVEIVDDGVLVVDTDLDGIPDAEDNCPEISNPEQDNVCQSEDFVASQLLTPLVAGRKITLKWTDQSAGVDKYQVLVSVSGENNYQMDIELLGSAMKEYRFTAISLGQSYDFKIRSLKGNEERESNVVSGTSDSEELANDLPAAPSMPRLSVNENCLLVFEFSDNSNNEKTYEVRFEYQGHAYVEENGDSNTPGENGYSWQQQQYGSTFEVQASLYQEAAQEQRFLSKTLPTLDDGNTPTGSSEDASPLPNNLRYKVKVKNESGESDYTEFSSGLSGTSLSSCYP